LTEKARESVAFDLGSLSSVEAYRLVTSVVVPRPIAWVTTVDDSGVVNAAPFSFFNVLGSTPPVVGVGVGSRGSGEPKDTARNAIARGEFVVNLVEDACAEAMNITGIDFPGGTSELLEANLTPAASLKVATPRIAESPFSLECRLAQIVEIGSNRILLGEIVCIQIRADLIGPENQIYTENAHLIARMHGRSGYARTSDLFHLDRISLANWRDRKKST
jgi:flavin reductase (DIM6/NTAB) family NADH-FMN oxidoreductase RutF